MSYEEPTKYDRSFGISVSPFIAAGDSDGTGSITVDSDMPNQGPSVQLDNGAYLKARSGNTGNVFFGFDSGVDSDGFELAAGDSIPVQVQNLSSLWFYSDTAGNGICWLKA